MKNAQGFSALNESGFRTYWLSTLATYAAAQMDAMIKGWLIYKMTGSAANLGLITLANGVPLVLISIFGGAVADRVDKKKMLIGTQVLAILFAVTMTVLLGTGLIQFWHFIVIAALQGANFALIGPLRQSLVPRLVRTENLLSAISLTSSSYNLMAFAAPAIAGLLLSVMPPQQVYMVIVFFFITGMVLLTLIKAPPSAATSRRPIYHDMLEGFRYIINNSKIRLLLIIAFVLSFFCAPYIFMVPALAVGTLKLNQQGLGFLLAAAGVGALTGSLATGFLASLKNRGLLLLALFVTFGTGIALSAQFGSFPLSMLMLLLAGMSGTALATINNSLLLLTTPSNLHGRVISVFAITMALTAIGALPMGAIADTAGIPLTFLSAGLISILFAIILRLFVPAIKKM